VTRRRVAVAVLLLAAACNSGQDPGLDVQPSGPSTTSNTLPPCPQQSAAGCLDEDGNVVAPG
jgi:hypothetical protein